jgi:hypothetical protein
MVNFKQDKIQKNWRINILNGDFLKFMNIMIKMMKNKWNILYAVLKALQ